MMSRNFQGWADIISELVSQVLQSLGREPTTITVEQK